MKTKDNEDLEFSADELRSEFQLERMILFSDAVFAIVITLMAIDLKIPKTHDPIVTDEGMRHALHEILPVFMAYTFSFLFIGIVWYRHLKLFSKLKDYDTGVVALNLMLLFFIGLFPFGASLLMEYKTLFSVFPIYLGLVFLSLLSQQLLHYYILIKRPALRRNVPIETDVRQIKVFNITLTCFALTLIAVFISPVFTDNFDVKQMVFLIGVAATGLITGLTRRHYAKKVSTSK